MILNGIIKSLILAKISMCPLYERRTQLYKGADDFNYFAPTQTLTANTSGHTVKYGVVAFFFTKSSWVGDREGNVGLRVNASHCSTVA